MQSAIQALIQQIGQALSGLSPFAKAVVPAATALVSAVVDMALAGAFNTTSLVILGVGVVSALVTYLVPNRPVGVRRGG